MKKIFTLFTTLFLIMVGSFTYSQCNIQSSICTPGTAGPFNFVGTGGAYADGSYSAGSCATGSGGSGNDYAFIILNITSNGPLNLLVDANTNGGFLDVIAFDIPPGVPPCTAIQDPSNEIACNYASAAGGCVQIGNAFPCTSTIPAPNVVSGQQIMIVVHDWSNSNNTFTLDLGPAPGAQTGPPDPTIINSGPFCESSTSIQLSGVSSGGTWTGPGVSSAGIFNPSSLGPGIYTITYDIGVAPCDAQSNTQIEVLPEYNSVDNISVCDGTSVTFPDGTSQVVSSNMSHISNLNTIGGCDSIITTNVSMSPGVTSTQNISVCDGTTVTFPDGSSQVIVGPVTQISTLVGGSISGCDSVVTTNVNITPVITSSVNTSVCENNNYTFPDGTIQTITGAVTQISTLVGGLLMDVIR